MLLKFVNQDFIEDRKFKNETEVNIKNYKILLGFINYCHEKGVVNVEEISTGECKNFYKILQNKGNTLNTINTKLQRIKEFFTI